MINKIITLIWIFLACTEYSASAKDTLELYTGDNINYQFSPISSNELKFKVKAKNDAHVALSSDFGIPTLCEIVLGGWSNTKSVIRKRGEDRGTQMGSMVDANNYVSFRVTWSDDTVSLYKEGNNIPVFVLKDNDLKQIKYFGIHAGFGSDAHWIFTPDPNPSGDQGCDVTKELYTGDDTNYQFSPINSKSLSFRVKARNDAHVALSSDFGIPALCEIVLGGWANTKSVIRKRNEERGSMPGQILTKNKYTSFKIVWSDQTLSVFKEGVTQPIFVLNDAGLKDIRYFGVHTGYQSDGYWVLTGFEGQGCDVSAGIYTGDDTSYQFFPVSSTVLNFKVKARNDAHISITSDFGIPTLCEIVLGGWANTNSVIRKRGQDRGSYPGPVVSGSKYTSFRVTWNDDSISVYKEGIYNPILVMRDQDFRHVKYAAIHTGFEADGYWSFTDMGNSNAGKECGIWKELFTGDNTNYQFYPVTSTTLYFKVKARNDAHLALSSDYEVPTQYEIVLGGWANTNSVLRKRGQDRASYSGQILAENSYTTFKVTWSKETLSVTKEGVSDPIFVLKDQDVKYVKYFGIHTGFGSDGSWAFIDPNVPARPGCNTQNNSTTTKPISRPPTNRRTCAVPAENQYGSFWATCDDDTDSNVQTVSAGRAADQGCRLHIKCKSGYYSETDNQSSAVCSGTSWFPSIPQCTRVCQSLTPQNVELTCTRNRLSVDCGGVLLPGTKVKIDCKQNYRQEYYVNYAEIECNQNGEWNRQLFKCLPECGRSNGKPTPLISNGTKEQYGDSPWHCAIYDLVDKENPNLICGGTIITEKVIISAAHCFFDVRTSKKTDANRYDVVVGKITRTYSTKDNTLQKTYKIQEIIFPEKGFLGVATNYVSDIAILVLTEVIKISSFVMPACLDRSGNSFNPGEGTLGKVVGWGVDGTPNSRGSDVLLGTNLPYISYANCVKRISDEFKTFVTLDKFCAGSETGPGVREGDSGGGLLFKDSQFNLYFVRGVVSLKPNVDTSIAMFTDISQYISWITTVSDEQDSIDVRITAGKKKN